MTHWIWKTPLFPALFVFLIGCPPSLAPPPGSGLEDTAVDETDGSILPEGFAEACKGKPFPDCKTAGVCAATDPVTGLSVVFFCNDQTADWECKYGDIDDYQKK